MGEPTLREARILDALVRRVRPAVLREFTADSCVATTRIALDVLEHFGFQGQAYPLLTVVLNPAATDLLHQGKTLSDIGPLTRHGGPWTIGLGARTPGQQFVGHVVLGSRDIGIVADLSIDQASRPEHDLFLRPFWQPVPPRWFADSTAIAAMESTSGVTIILDRSLCPDPVAYQRSPNWHRQPESVMRPLIAEMIRQVTADLVD
jgi:hypothetical protein